jgi:hypothetical protein
VRETVAAIVRETVVEIAAYKGAGTLLHMLHVCYSFPQKCSKLDTFTDQGPNILETGIKFKKLVLN